ncbi:uncharacterized protein PSFLO_03674 [Pseudozyma flocculosa]|uniref:Uncharacterized protein n=1 Tax=Pseudozyma flocculosa TaxID=84751 RepID=A0A5C3F3E3_9BASI|nr:uncharacterized protein PSFLO_03674 [Pseudozyma flocculosa]
MGGQPRLNWSGARIGRLGGAYIWALDAAGRLAGSARRGSPQPLWASPGGGQDRQGSGPPHRTAPHPWPSVFPSGNLLQSFVGCPSSRPTDPRPATRRPRPASTSVAVAVAFGPTLPPHPPGSHPISSGQDRTESPARRRPARTPASPSPGLRSVAIRSATSLGGKVHVALPNTGLRGYLGISSVWPRSFPPSASFPASDPPRLIPTFLLPITYLPTSPLLSLVADPRPTLSASLAPSRLPTTTLEQRNLAHDPPRRILIPSARTPSTRNLGNPTTRGDIPSSDSVLDSPSSIVRRRRRLLTVCTSDDVIHASSEPIRPAHDRKTERNRLGHPPSLYLASPSRYHQPSTSAVA